MTSVNGVVMNHSVIEKQLHDFYVNTSDIPHKKNNKSKNQVFKIQNNIFIYYSLLDLKSRIPKIV